MRKLPSLLSLCALLVLPFSALATSGSSGYNEPIAYNDFNFQATLNGDQVDMRWAPYAPDGFNYYKVVRSTTNSDPVYPDDGYILASGDPTLSSYTDQNPESGTSYYRVCSIASPDRYCSQVVTINYGGGTESPESSQVMDPSGYYPYELRESFNFKAALDDGQVVMSWTPYAPDGFNFYKVVRSTTNSDPVYPNDGYVLASSNSGLSSYTDKAPEAGTSYYRICSIAKPYRYCSLVVTIKHDGSADSVLEAAGIELMVSMGEDGVALKWEVTGSAPYGFKLAKSYSHQNPTYPPMDEDSVKLLSNSDQRSFMDRDLKAGKTVYYRVCQYSGSGSCLAYSNSVSVAIPSDFTGKTLIYTKSTSDATDDEYAALKAEISALKEEVTELKAAFNDIAQHQYATAIDYLREKAIVQGYDDGTYRPDYQINRAEFMKIVMGEKYKDELNETLTDCFNDVGKDWYAAYVCLGKNKGIISGYGDNTFKPGQNISFVEAAKILANVYGLDLGEEGTDWYEKYVRALQEEGYIPASVSTLSKPITRAEMAELIWRIKEQKKDETNAKLLAEPVKLNEGDYAGWTIFSGEDFMFYHPGWYQGEKWGRTLLTDELDFYQNLTTSNYMDVDSYMTVYSVSGTDLATTLWSEHPLVSSQEFTINGVPALKRHFRAPRGTVVNGRTTGENENITVYSFLVNGRTVVLEYFNAYGTENKNVETFYKIANSFRLK